MLSGRARANDAGGGSLYSSMVGDLPEVRRPLPGAQPICARQIRRARVERGKVRSSTAFSDDAIQGWAKRGERRSPTLFRKIVTGKRCRRPGAGYETAPLHASDYRWRWSATRRVA